MGSDERTCCANQRLQRRAHGRLPGPSRFPVDPAMQRGYTLFELLTVVAVVGIVAAVALPAFNSMIVSNRLSSVTNALIGSIRQAQVEGVRHNGNAQFCSNSATSNGSDLLGQSCGTTNLGAVMYQQLGSGGSTSYQQTQAKVSLPTNVTVGDGTNGTTALAALRFGSNGLASTPGSSTPFAGLVADVYTTSISTNNHRCIYMATGSQLSSCIYTGGLGACPTNEPSTCQQQFQQK
jgi:type IV fimbrial biogenesis protein FimT